jgi:uncharacterized protein (DUF433 family)
MVIPDELKDIVSSDPETLGGKPCFTGTRIPVRTLFDHLDDESTLSDFLERYPSVPKESVLRFMAWVRDVTIAALQQEWRGDP